MSSRHRDDHLLCQRRRRTRRIAHPLPLVERRHQFFLCRSRSENGLSAVLRDLQFDVQERPSLMKAAEQSGEPAFGQRCRQDRSSKCQHCPFELETMAIEQRIEQMGSANRGSAHEVLSPSGVSRVPCRFRSKSTHFPVDVRAIADASTDRRLGQVEIFGSPLRKLPHSATRIAYRRFRRSRARSGTGY